MQKIVEVDSNASFKKLSVYWSPNNVAASGTLALGQIGTSFFRATKSAGVVTARDLYLLGKANNDTDEYDRHVVAHEFGHYLQSLFSRNDSIGGSHGGSNDRLDMRVAFSEGWGNAWSGYALGNRFYADTFGASQASISSFDISAGEATNPGWFKEASVQKVIWDLSTGSVGFGSVWTALKTGLTTSHALTSAHSFANALRVNLPSSLATLNAVFNSQSITVPSDAYGTGETNFGSPAIAELNPIYTAYAALGSVSKVCVTNAADTARAGNKAGEHRYLKLTGLPAGARTFTIARDLTTMGASIATDPDFSVYNSTGEFVRAESSTANAESTNVNLTGGNYVLALTDFTFRTSTTLRRPCFNVTVNSSRAAKIMNHYSTSLLGAQLSLQLCAALFLGATASGAIAHNTKADCASSHYKVSKTKAMPNNYLKGTVKSAKTGMGVQVDYVFSGAAVDRSGLLQLTITRRGGGRRCNHLH